MENASFILSQYEKLLRAGPSFLDALLILLLGLVFAFAFRKTVLFATARLARSKNDRISQIAKSRNLHSFADSISKLLFWTAILIASSIVFEVFGISVLDEWLKKITEFVPSLIGAILVALTGLLLARFLRQLSRETIARSRLEAGGNIPSLVYYSTLGVSILMAVQQLGIEIGFLTTSIQVILLCVLLGGAISFGVGSAPVVTNLLSTHYLRKRIKVGQQISSAEINGSIVEIGSTFVMLQCEDGVLSVPSRQLNESNFKVIHARN